MDVAGKVLKMRRDGHELIKMMGGRRVHPNWGLPGGVSRGINEEQRKEIEKLGRDAVEFAKFSLQVFADIVLKNTKYVEVIKSDAYVHRTYNMGHGRQEQHGQLLRRQDPRHQPPAARNSPSTTPRTTANTSPSASSSGPI